MLNLAGYTVTTEDMDCLHKWLHDIDQVLKINKYRVLFTNSYDYAEALKAIHAKFGFKSPEDMPVPEPQPKDTTWAYNGTGGVVAVPYLLGASHQHLKEIRVEPELLGKRSVARKRLEASGLGTSFILPVRITNEVNRTA